MFRNVSLSYELLRYTYTNLNYVNRFRIFIPNFPLTSTLIREVKKNRVIRLKTETGTETETEHRAACGVRGERSGPQFS